MSVSGSGNCTFWKISLAWSLSKVQFQSQKIFKKLDRYFIGSLWFIKMTQTFERPFDAHFSAVFKFWKRNRCKIYPQQIYFFYILCVSNKVTSMRQSQEGSLVSLTTNRNKMRKGQWGKFKLNVTLYILLPHI